MGRISLDSSSSSHVISVAIMASNGEHHALKLMLVNDNWHCNTTVIS